MQRVKYLITLLSIFTQTVQCLGNDPKHVQEAHGLPNRGNPRPEPALQRDYSGCESGYKNRVYYIMEKNCQPIPEPK